MATEDSGNSDWLTRSRAALWHPCTQMKHLERVPPLPIARGEGPWLVDFDGRRYLDAISSWWVNLFGHANPRINAAIVDQMCRIEHVMLAGCTHAPVVELSERLAGLTGLGHAFYGSDGASATEIALKMSFQFWRNVGQPAKTGFVSLEYGYHGETLGALSVTDVALFKDTYAPLLRPTHQVISPDWRRAEDGESAESYALRAAASLEDFLAECADTTAAVILEPLVQGAAGMAMYHPVYLACARESCDRHRVHLIADEIAVGFGRTGTLFACEQADIRPDFLCLSKGITGGYLPLSCVLTTDAVFAAFYDDATARGFLHSHSYTGNALACRAALAVLDLFEQDEVLAVNRHKAVRFTQLLAPIAAHPRVRHFRHTGMIWAFDVEQAPAGFSVDFHRRALERGLFIRPIGASVYFMPPYVIGEAEMAHMAKVTLELLDTL
ncbi:MAG: adenosylmethionine-8-amino-7-oxononanoate aminotransferase [bacterium]|nr:MAG: adenosylmethionine-8-amino-7-oxononanoate aminotransferase [bacterium]KAF0149297.1 MAG: adenosylmethionine-8-amino-7-oxononanoate aminotransferase [bacterium]KAF0169819.1 MAG: adenosylmethionine-8-amino-7-oxononanoate aminotransferase [bacterium]TXT22743.1 MAG: adenosylmethionine-8-amino-7-oxononanoate aminotransferase [bacterium]